jgi:hypothetical protein
MHGPSKQKGPVLYPGRGRSSTGSLREFVTERLSCLATNEQRPGDQGEKCYSGFEHVESRC